MGNASYFALVQYYTVYALISSLHHQVISRHVIGGSYLEISFSFLIRNSQQLAPFHNDDVMKLKRFLRYLPLCREFAGHRWIPHTKASNVEIFSLICTWTNGWVNNRDVGDLRRHGAHYYVTVMIMEEWWKSQIYIYVFFKQFSM